MLPYVTVKHALDEFFLPVPSKLRRDYRLLIASNIF